MLTFYKAAKFLFRHVLPRRLHYPLARWIARITCRFNRARREVIVGNLTPLLGADQARARAPELLGHFLMTAVDFFCMPPSLPSAVPIEPWSLFEDLQKSGAHILFVTAHVGHWELGISSLVARGVPVTGVYAPYRDDAVVEWIMRHRNPKAEWIPTTPGAADACLEALKKGRVLGMAGDIPFGERGLRVRIAGHTARLPIGPWVIAVKANAVVIPAFILREAPGRYRGILHPPLRPRGGNLRQQTQFMQNAYAQVLETYLKAYPTQWGVLQPFWEKDS